MGNFCNLSNQLHLSFKGQDSGNAAGNKEDLLEATKQKITDTDVDGLSDWEELNTYGTSPYLADSDSDGTIDSAELSSGADPNCPQGQDCGASGLPSPAAGGASSTANTSANTEAAAPALRAEDLNSLTPEEIRVILKEGGATDEDLQGVSDEDLKSLVQEVIQQEPVTTE